MAEEWRPVVGFEGRYLVSDHGRVINTQTGKVLKPIVRNRKGYLAVCLSYEAIGRPRRLYNLHRLVAEHFLGPLPIGLHTLHLDEDKSNNRLDNLAYGTPLENQRSLITHLGGNHESRKTHCPQDHPYAGDNLYITKQGWRGCRTCRDARNKAR